MWHFSAIAGSVVIEKGRMQLVEYLENSGTSPGDSVKIKSASPPHSFILFPPEV